jgi:hypothetical protein
MIGAIPPLPQYALIAWCSPKKKHRDTFTFTIAYFILKYLLALKFYVLNNRLT